MAPVPRSVFSALTVHRRLILRQLYYCDGHPLARQEEPFPDPDNNFKLQRSHQNAAHIGTLVSQYNLHNANTIQQAFSVLVAAAHLTLVSIVTVVDSSIEAHLLPNWKNSSQRTGMSYPQAQSHSIHLLMLTSFHRYLRTVAGLRRSRGGMQAY